VFEAQGAFVVYVDLWENGGALGSQALIARAIGRGLESCLGFIERTAKGAGVKELSSLGFKLDTSKIGSVDGLTLTEALRLLHEKSGKKIALIIDEAQHALTSDDGDKVMLALKSARDQMRVAGDGKLMLVMSGSHKDKLARLVMGNAAPFYGSAVEELPFAAARTKALRLFKPEYLSLDLSVMQQAFVYAQERPQVFDRLIANALKESKDLASFEQTLVVLSQLTLEEDRQLMQERYAALEPLQQALFVELLEKGKHFQPMATETLKRLSQQLGESITVRDAQTALDNLCKMERQTEPPFIWKAGRASWDVYDQGMLTWYEFLKNAGQWPSL
jgi:hypothetical protein